jgi:hypothetical protein
MAQTCGASSGAGDNVDYDVHEFQEARYGTVASMTFMYVQYAENVDYRIL